jgi:site-specific DNA-methyltransferase (cytosine-N4-specific)
MENHYAFQLPSYYIQPFERELAKLQINMLSNSGMQEFDGKFLVSTQSPIGESHLRKLAFFREINEKYDSHEKRIIPDQTFFERATQLIRRAKDENELLGFLSSIDVGQSGRKEPQYLTHHIHSYKGRFYPQMIRALVNSVGAKKGDLILDPFCGCGTTLLECYLMDIDSIGIDLHPLACLIARSKIEILSLDPKTMINAIRELMHGARRDAGKLQSHALDSFIQPQTPISDLPPLPDMPNLEKWFSPDVLAKIRIIMKHVDRIEDKKMQAFFKVALSSILRQISNWDNRQVRVRLLKEPRQNVAVLEIFEEKLLRTYYSVVAFQRLRKKLRLGGEAETQVLNEDSRQMKSVDSDSVDAIITSPPYAMALPYIDADRLSLFMLGYVDRKGINDLIGMMIGNREISYNQRKKWDNEFKATQMELDFPRYFKETLLQMIQENEDLSETAFRRKNMPALLYKYFLDMISCIREMDRVLKHSGHCVIIVGNNYTTTGKNKVVNIETDRILLDIAVERGWSLTRKLTKELTSTSPPPLSKIRYESILIFRKS